MKKLGIIIFIILILAVFTLSGLWYLGGQKNQYQYIAPPLITARTEPPLPAIRQFEEEKFYESLISPNPEAPPDQPDQDVLAANLVINALKKKQAPLLPLEILPAARAPNRLYQLNDLRLENLTSGPLLTEYGQKLAQIMSVYRSPGLGSELTRLAEVTEAGNQESLNGISAAVARYQTTIKQLLALTVPETAGQIHLNLINSLARLMENAKLMTRINEEPLLAMGAAQLQTSRLRQILTDIGNVNLFFAGNILSSENKTGKTIIVIDL